MSEQVKPPGHCSDHHDPLCECWQGPIAVNAQAEIAEPIEHLRLAYAHWRKIISAGKSEFIKENGRNDGSPWSELMDAIRNLLGEKS